MKLDYKIPYFRAYPTNEDQKLLLSAFGFKFDKTLNCFLHHDPKKARHFSVYETSDKAKEVIRKFGGSKRQSTDSEFPCPEGLSYLPYQKSGIEFLLENERSLLADEPGLGKTIQIAGLINSLEPNKVLILCPASLRINWKKELKKWSNREAVTDFDSKADTVIMSYDSLTSKGRFAKLRLIEWDLIVLDESHYCKNPEAKRTQATMALLTYSKRVVFMSGTPLVNRPLELYPMLNFFDKEYFTDERAYAFRYCGAFYREIRTKFGVRKVLDKGGATRTDELSSILRGNYMLRRRKSDVLKQLPKKIRQLIELEVKKTEFKEIENISQKVIFTDEDLQLGKGFEIGDMAILRQKIAEIKLPYAIAFIKMRLESTDKLVIFCHHKNVVEGLMEGLSEHNPVKLVGGMSDKDKNKSVESFQEDENVKVFIGNIQAAGVGITLTAASNVIFVEIVPVPGLLTQAEDRCVRIGATAESVLIQHLVVSESLDERICDMVVRKQNVSDSILADNSQKIF